MDEDIGVVDTTPQLMGLTCISCKEPNTVTISPREYSHIKNADRISIRNLKKCMCAVCKEGL